MPRVRRCALALATTLVLIAAPVARAQNGRIDFTLTGGPLLFPAPTATDFATGFAPHPTGLTFQVDVANSVHPSTILQTTVSVRGTSPTLGGNGKPLGDLEWSLGGTGPWAPLTLTDATIESRTVRRNRMNDPWGNVIQFRMRLAWASDVPATYTSGIVVTLTVTGP